MERKFSWYRIMNILVVASCILLVISCSDEIDTPSIETDTLLLGSSGYVIGDIGPAGGYVFYDKGSYSDGWRYLEAAPKDVGVAIFGYYYQTEPFEMCAEVGTANEMGTGETNTPALVAAMGSTAHIDLYIDGTTANYAAKNCADVEVTKDGVTYDDYFLPSITELDTMYRNLYLNNLGRLEGILYWSSSEFNAFGAWYQDFRDGHTSIYGKSYPISIRPIRAF